MTGSFVDISGRRLHRVRAGTGAPVVLLESGLGGTYSDWEALQPLVAEFTTVFAYDRAGLGLSEPAPTPRILQDLVNDLSAFLQAAGVASPCVLVGHSLGGLIVRLFAAQHPAAVAGMVLVDSTHEDKYERFDEILSAELRERNRKFVDDPTRNAEQLNLRASARQVREAAGRFDFPVRVLARGLPDQPSSLWPTEALQKIEFSLQRRLLSISPDAKFIRADRSGHFIQNDQPGLVADVIHEVVALARQHAARPKSTSL